jgi:hypothetical protein
MTGKSIITYDMDVEERHNNEHERTMLGMEYRYVQYICNHKPSWKHDRVWQNHPVPNGKPGQGFCSEFTTNWLLGLLEHRLRGATIMVAWYHWMGFARFDFSAVHSQNLNHTPCVLYMLKMRTIFNWLQ